MKLNNFFKVVIAAFVISFALPFAANAVMVNTAYSTPVNGGEKDAELYSRIVTRVSEIERMDKTNLNASEKKSLRKELKEMKKAADGLNSKVYLSVGAIIIIILLLILILR